jgi:CRISPR/Cas system-associated protein Cas10 (large subunit of type III CRISPR-Cas system)
MLYTVFVRKSTKKHNGEADKATTPCYLGGTPGYFVGCCVGDDKPEGVVVYACGDDPVALLDEIGAVMVVPDGQVV